MLRITQEATKFNRVCQIFFIGHSPDMLENGKVVKKKIYRLLVALHDKSKIKKAIQNSDGLILWMDVLIATEFKNLIAQGNLYHLIFIIGCFAQVRAGVILDAQIIAGINS